MSAAAPEVRIGIRRLELGGRLLFENLSFRLEAGQWTCLLGPSGVGKTSLLRAIAGLLPGALVSADGGGLEGRIALMAQQDLLLPWLPALDNTLLGHRLRGTSRAELAGSASAPASCWRALALPVTSAACRLSSRAACASAWPWPAR